MFATPSESSFKPTFHGTPTILIQEQCARDIWYVVQATREEVGWLCVCNETDSGNFLLTEVLLPKQQCSAATTELLPDALTEIGMEVLSQDDAAGIKPEDERYRYNHMNCWMHSHGAGGVSPSGQDNQQMVEFCQMYGSAYSAFIRGIANRKGDMQFAVYYKCSRTWKPITDVPWSIIGRPDSERERYWQALVKERVRDIAAASSFHRPELDGPRAVDEHGWMSRRSWDWVPSRV